LAGIDKMTGVKKSILQLPRPTFIGYHFKRQTVQQQRHISQYDSQKLAAYHAARLASCQPIRIAATHNYPDTGGS